MRHISRLIGRDLHELPDQAARHSGPFLVTQVLFIALSNATAKLDPLTHGLHILSMCLPSLPLVIFRQLLLVSLSLFIAYRRWIPDQCYKKSDAWLIFKCHCVEVDPKLIRT